MNNYLLIFYVFEKWPTFHGMAHMSKIVKDRQLWLKAHPWPSLLWGIIITLLGAFNYEIYQQIAIE